MISNTWCKYVDENDVNVHIDSLAQFFTSRTTTYNKEPSISTLACLDELNCIFEHVECIDFKV